MADGRCSGSARAATAAALGTANGSRSTPVVVGWEDAVAGRGVALPGEAAATIGTFDGVHRGHAALLHQLRRADVRCRVAVTFRVPPRSVLNGAAVAALMTAEQRYRALGAAGVSHVVVIDFSDEFGRMPGKDFLAALTSALPLVRLVVGSSFRCGRGRDTDVAAMRRLLAPNGVEVDPVPPVQVNGQPISSSRIRRALGAGDIRLAAELLGHPYEVALAFRGDDILSEGESEEGLRFSVGRERVGQLLPPPGHYTGRLRDGDGTVPVTVEITDYSMDVSGDHALANGRMHAIELMARK